jgi:hypothetical protein
MSAMHSIPARPPNASRGFRIDLTIARQMTAADFLKLRQRIGNVAVAVLLACGPTAAFFIVRAAQHASNPLRYQAAGGLHGFEDAVRGGGGLTIFVGLAAILIGTDAGAGDHAAGVFRDLVITGRSRLALFATRIPAAIALTWIIATAAYAIALIGVFALASGTPTPSASQLLDAYGFYLLSTSVICAIAVGMAALTASRVTALVILIGWHLIASPLLTGINSLGSPRKLILSQAIDHFSPVQHGSDTGGGGAGVTMTQTTALIVLICWLAVFLALGAWRTRTMDA